MRQLIKNRLVELDMKQGELARRAQIMPHHVSEYLHGRRNFGPEVMSRVCDVLGLQLTVKPKED